MKFLVPSFPVFSGQFQRGIGINDSAPNTESLKVYAGLFAVLGEVDRVVHFRDRLHEDVFDFRRADFGIMRTDFNSML